MISTGAIRLGACSAIHLIKLLKSFVTVPTSGIPFSQGRQHEIAHQLVAMDTQGLERRCLIKAWHGPCKAVYMSHKVYQAAWEVLR